MWPSRHRIRENSCKFIESTTKTSYLKEMLGAMIIKKRNTMIFSKLSITWRQSNKLRNNGTT